MKASHFAIGALLLLACRRSSPETRVVDGGPPPNPSQEEAPPPDTSDWTRAVPFATGGGEPLVGPLLFAGQPPSVEHPQGTVYSESSREESAAEPSAATKRRGDDQEEQEPTPFTFEWDLANRSVVQTWEKAALLDFDGRRLFMKRGSGTRCSLEVYDTHDKRSRTLPFACDWKELVATRGGGFIVTKEKLDAEGTPVRTNRNASVATFASFDANGAQRARTTLITPGPTPMLEQRGQCIHAGDSVYTLSIDAADKVTLVRLDDKTLRERGRSAPFPLDFRSENNDVFATLRKSDDRWYAWVNGSFYSVTATLDSIGGTEPSSKLTRPEDDDWYEGRAFSSLPIELPPWPCTLRWVYGRRAAGCYTGDDGYVMVTPPTPKAE